MKNIKAFILFLALSGFMISCEDFLEQQPIGSYNESVLATSQGVEKLLIGAYSSLNGSAMFTDTPDQALWGCIRGGEANKGSTTTDLVAMVEIQKFEVTASNTYVQSAFTGFYDGIYRCNMVLKTLPLVTDMSDANKTRIIAEARFLRAHYYFMLKRIFSNIPFLDETNFETPKQPNADGSGNYVDIWPKIKEDFDFARNNLPESQAQPAKPNKWAAEAYYAKVLIYMGNEGNATAYADALTVLNDIITNGKTNKGVNYSLLPYYHDNFNADKENHVEWVWGVQHSNNDGIGTTSPNSTVSLQGMGTQNSAGPSTGWGFFQPTQWFVDHFRVNSEGLPFLDMYTTNPLSVKSDDGVPSASPFTTDTAKLDPRLDWSVGRRGIPFLDYGVFPGASWIRQQDHGGPYMSKKWFTLKKDIGKYTYPGSPRNALNMPIIRYADVLLMAAEEEARHCSLDIARTYVNAIRNRMVQNSDSPDNWVKKADGSNAANYKIGLYPDDSPAFATRPEALKAILYERMLELGLEGHRAYDVIRFGNADNTTDVEEFNSFIAFESVKRIYLKGGVYTRMPDKVAPLPQTALDRSLDGGVLTLKQNPGY